MTEKTLRRRAYKVNLQVVKGFKHYRGHVIHDEYGNRETGYMVKDILTNQFVWDGFNAVYDFLWTLEDVESFLRKHYENLGCEW